MAHRGLAGKNERRFNLNGRMISVRTLDEGRAAWLALRDSEGLGASDMVRGCGDYFENGVKVAHVSFNGRMWTPEPFPACTEIRP